MDSETPRRVRLIRPDERTRDTGQTPGMTREQAVATNTLWAGHARTAPGMASGWHHHGDYDSTIYVLSGALRMESGPGGHEVIDARPGDFVFVPRMTIHRESNPTDEDADLVVVRVGRGAAVTNVDGPAPTA